MGASASALSVGCNAGFWGLDEQTLAGALPSSVIEVYCVPKTSTCKPRRKLASRLLYSCVKPVRRRVLLWQAKSRRVVFRVAILASAVDASVHGSAAPEHLIPRSGFNCKLPAAKFDTIRLQIDMLGIYQEPCSSPRFLFGYVCDPPHWTMEMLQ